MKVIFTAKRAKDNYNLHLVEREGKCAPFVVCWNLNMERGDWDWGTYCGSLLNGLDAFMGKVKEHEFAEVFEGYV